MEADDLTKDMVLPSQFELRASGTDPNKLGIWCKEPVRSESTFGPFPGERVDVCPENADLTVQQVDESEKFLYFPDGSRAEKSSWLQHLRWATKEGDQNIACFQNDFCVCFRALRDINPGEELLIWKVPEKRPSGTGVKRAISSDASPLFSLPKKKNAGQKAKKSSASKSPGSSPSPKKSVKKSSFQKIPPSANKESILDSSCNVEIDDKFLPSSSQEPQNDSEESESGSLDALTACNKTPWVRLESLDGKLSNLDAPTSCERVDEAKYFSFKLKSHHVAKGRQGKRIFKCDVCTKAYRYAFSLKRHFLRNHVNYKYLTTADLTNCNISPSVNSRSGPEKPHRGECNETFPDLFQCRKCSLFFDVLDELKNHYAIHNDALSDKQPRRYSCPKCDMSFVMKQNLKRHLVVHSGEKRFACQYCPKAFPTQANRKRHERIHEGVKPYSCAYCSSAFTQSGDLRKHVKKQHPDFFHLCNFCPKYFASKALLRKHLAQHGETLKSNQIRKKVNKGKAGDGEPCEQRQDDACVRPNPRKKYLCAVCKQRFVTYSSMCRHREEAHPPKPTSDKQSRPSSRSKSDLAVSKSPTTKVVRNHQCSEEEFYMNIASKIADNLLNHVDGKYHQLHLKVPGPGSGLATEPIDPTEVSVPDFVDGTSASDFRTDCNFTNSSQDSIADIFNGVADNSLDDNCNKKSERYSFLGLSEYACTQYYSSYNVESASDDGSDEDSNGSRRNSESSESAFGRSLSALGDSINFCEPPPVTYICSTCSEVFNSLDVIEDHKLNNHPNVFCTHIEIDGDKDIPRELLQNEYSPYGLLGTCCTDLLPSANISSESLNCTKCSKPFDAVSELHLHILECGIHSDFRRQKRHRVRVSRKKGRPTKQLAKISTHRRNKKKSGKSKQFDAKVSGGEDASTSFANSAASAALQSSQKSPSPKKIFSCAFCGKMFKYLKAFERHTQGCSLRNRLTSPHGCNNHRRILSQGRPPDLHKCKHCHSLFRGLVNLKQHIASGCRKSKYNAKCSKEDKTKKASKVILPIIVPKTEPPEVETDCCKIEESTDEANRMRKHMEEKLKEKLSRGLQSVPLIANHENPLADSCSGETANADAGFNATANLDPDPASSHQSSKSPLFELPLINPAVALSGLLNRKITSPTVSAIREKLTEKLHRGLKLNGEAKEEPGSLPDDRCEGEPNTEERKSNCLENGFNDNENSCKKEETIEDSLDLLKCNENSRFVPEMPYKEVESNFSSKNFSSLESNKDSVLPDLLKEVHDSDLNGDSLEESPVLLNSEVEASLEVESKNPLQCDKVTKPNPANKSTVDSNASSLPIVPNTGEPVDDPASSISAAASSDCEPQQHAFDVAREVAAEVKKQLSPQQESDASEVIFEKAVDPSQQIVYEAIDISGIAVNCAANGPSCSGDSDRDPPLSVDVQSLVQLVKLKLKEEKDEECLPNSAKIEPASPRTSRPSSVLPSLEMPAATPKVEIIRTPSPATVPTQVSYPFPNAAGISTLHHQQQQKHTCSACLRSFAYLANYRKHLKEVCPVKRQQMEEENRKLGSTRFKPLKDSPSPLSSLPSSPSAAIPLAGTSSLSSRGQVERSVIGLLRDQLHQQELMKNSAASRFCKYECSICHKIFFNFVMMMRHNMSHKLDNDGAGSAAPRIKREDTTEAAAPKSPTPYNAANDDDEAKDAEKSDPALLSDASNGDGFAKDAAEKAVAQH